MYIFLFEAYSWLKLLETKEKFLKFLNNHKDCPLIDRTLCRGFYHFYNYFTFAFQNVTYFSGYNIYTLQTVFQFNYKHSVYICIH